MHVEVIITVNTGDLLNNIRLHGDVLRRTPGGYGHAEAVAVEGDGKAEAFQRFHDRAVVDRNTGIFIDKRFVKVDRALRITVGIFIGQRRNNDRTAVVGLQQLQETRDRLVAQFRVKALFITHGSVGTVTEAHGGFTDGRRVKGSGLQRQRRGILHDLAVKAAHNTGDRHRRFVVTDHQRIFVDRSVHAVERLEGERLVKAPDADLADLTGVKGVHRLTHFEHEIVRQVGQEVNGTHTAVIQADTHIHRRHAALNVFHLHTGIAVAQRVKNFQIDLRQGVIIRQRDGIERLERSAGQRRKLSGDAVVTPQVRTVCQRLIIHLKHNIIDRIERLDVRTVLHVVGDLHDTAVIVGNTDFLFTAAHAVAHEAGQRTRRDLNFTELGTDLGKGRFHTDSDVRRTADDVRQLCLAGIHL